MNVSTFVIFSGDRPEPLPYEGKQSIHRHVAAAVGLIAQLHTRFAGHPLLLECRKYGGDLGIYYFSSNVRDAIRCACDLTGLVDVDL